MSEVTGSRESVPTLETPEGIMRLLPDHRYLPITPLSPLQVRLSKHGGPTSRCTGRRHG